MPRTHFPGEEIVSGGIADLAAGRPTAEALVVASAQTRLRSVGVDVPFHEFDTSGRELYRAIERDVGAGAHSRFNALTRQVVAYCAARAQDGRRQEADAARR